MVKDFHQLSEENEKLTHEKDALTKKLDEANEIIEIIKKGNIDGVFNSNNGIAKVLVTATADQTYRRFIENMTEGVVTTLSDGIILYCNSSFAGIVNLPLENITGKNLRDFIPVEYKETFEQFFKEYAQDNTKIELSILHHAGGGAHFIVSLNTLYLKDLMALNFVWTDVTGQKKTEEKLLVLNENLINAIRELTLSENKVVILNNRLEENINILTSANIELAAFAHIASHDLQEPLRKILTYSSILKSDYYDAIGLEGQNYINKIQGASARMRNLINDILQYSALSQEELVFKPTSLQVVVDEIFSDLEIVIKETKATITIAKPLPVIEANASQMRQLFQNILSNSLKFIKAGVIPQISITYEMVPGKEIGHINKNMRNEEYCICYIKDNGIGFNPAYISKIFTIFQKLNNNSEYQGTGIGLAICKKIVEKHHGFITADSQLKEGALFTITLPVYQQHDPKKIITGVTAKVGIISP